MQDQEQAEGFRSAPSYDPGIKTRSCTLMAAYPKIKKPESGKQAEQEDGDCAVAQC